MKPISDTERAMLRAVGYFVAGLAVAVALMFFFSGCASPLTVADDLNRTLGYRAVSFDAHCTSDAMRDARTECVELVWRSLPNGMRGHTFPPRASYMPWTIALDESIRDDLPTVRAALAHELGHVLGLPDEVVSGRLMSGHLTQGADTMLGEVRR